MAQREFNDVKINVEFEEAGERQQIDSGEDIKGLFGKIKKWFSDLKPVAFSGKYSDLEEIPKYTPAKSGFYKIEVDENGNVSSVTPVTKEDIIGLGVDTGYDFVVGDDGHLYVKPKGRK